MGTKLVITPRQFLSLVVFLPSLIAAAPPATAENWTAGLDTTKPGWYLEHPSWVAMKKRFDRKCDSVEAALRKQIPKTPDTIWRREIGHFRFNQKNLRWLTSRVLKYKDTLPQALALHPIHLRSKPVNGAVVGVLSPKNGPVRIFSEFTIAGGGRFTKARQDWYKQIHQYSAWDDGYAWTPFDQVLLADSVGNLLGWTPWDSIAGFGGIEEIRCARRLYSEGFADLLNGVYMFQSRTWPVIQGRTEPLATAQSGNICRIDMFRRQIVKFGLSNLLDGRGNPLDPKMPTQVLDRECPKKNAPYFSWIKNPATGIDERYLDPRKIEMTKKMEVHHFFNMAEIYELPPFTIEPNPGCMMFRASLRPADQASGVSKLVMKFGTSPSSEGFEFEIPYPASDCGILQDGFQVAIKRNMELMP